jgi:hypothetical protein
MMHDIVQEVLMKLQDPGTLARLESSRAPAGYLAVMVRNAATNLMLRDSKML